MSFQVDDFGSGVFAAEKLCSGEGGLDGVGGREDASRDQRN